MHMHHATYHSELRFALGTLLEAPDGRLRQVVLPHLRQRIVRIVIRLFIIVVVVVTLLRLLLRLCLRLRLELCFRVLGQFALLLRGQFFFRFIEVVRVVVFSVLDRAMRSMILSTSPAVLTSARSSRVLFAAACSSPATVLGPGSGCSEA